MVPPPPPPPSNPQLFRNPYKATRDILLAAKAAFKAVPVKTAPVEAAVCDPNDHGSGKEDQFVGKEDQVGGKEDQAGGKEEHSYALANPQALLWRCLLT